MGNHLGVCCLEETMYNKRRQAIDKERKNSIQYRAQQKSILSQMEFPDPSDQKEINKGTNSSGGPNSAYQSFGNAGEPAKVQMTEDIKNSFKALAHDPLLVEPPIIENDDDTEALTEINNPPPMSQKTSITSVYYEPRDSMNFSGQLYERRQTIENKTTDLSISDPNIHVHNQMIEETEEEHETRESAKEVFKEPVKEVKEIILSPFHADLIKKGEQFIELSKAQNLANYNDFEKIYVEKKNPHKLEVYFTSYDTPEKKKINRIRTEWYLPFKPDQFLEFMNNYEEQCKIDTDMDVFTKVDQVSLTNGKEDNCYIWYLSYKKVLIADPRDFLYLKYFKRYSDTHWADVSKSVEHAKHPDYKDKVRGEMILCGHFVTREDDPVTGAVRTKVRYYSECNFKTSVPAFLAKAFCGNTMKKYYEKIIERMEVIYGRQN